MGDTWARVLVLSLGGALGVNARYGLGQLVGRWADPRFPWGTLVINVSGSFAIGFLAIVLAHRWPHPLARLFLVTGFLGGYTTFSSFAYESLVLWEEGDRRLSVANAVGSVAAGLVTVALGAGLARATFVPSASKAPEARAAIEPLPTEAFLEEADEAG